MAKVSLLYLGELVNTPLGSLWLAASGHGLAAIQWGVNQAEFAARLARRFGCAVEHAPARLEQATAELDEYLQGRRRQFTLAVDWSLLRPFQCQVLQATWAIPYGETATYKQIAEQIHRQRAARAVGRAEATNPIPLVIPCHRVIGSDGKLHGYGLGEGLRTKEWLLKMEGALIA